MSTKENTDHENSSRQPYLNGRYKKYLIEFLSFRDNVEYVQSTDFTPEHLRTITPEQVVRWLNKKIYETPDPSPYDEPIGKSASLEHYKKSLSFFMPDKDVGK
jgi:hypothetical protein